MRPPVLRALSSLVAVAVLAGAGALALAPGHSPRGRPRLAAPPTPTLRLPAAPRTARCPHARPVHEHLITRPRWLRNVAVTEYYSAPERWFAGRRIRTPGLSGRHRVDWLYSAHGVAMQGDGIGLDGRHYHIADTGTGGWVNRNGHLTVPGRCAGHWSRGRPVWLQGGWRNARGRPTFPLAAGGWSDGPGDHARSYQGVTFAPGSTLALHPYRTLAVDPRLIPRGSRVYIPFYKTIAGGWFVAQDTGGAIIGRHVDVYRPPTSIPLDGGRFLRHQRVYVVPPR